VLYLEKENNMKKIISTLNAPEAIGPYSQAVLQNNTLYCSGQIALNPRNNKLIIDNIVDETHQVMKNIHEILKEANMDFNNIVKCTIFLKNMNDYLKVNEVYSTYFTSQPPAREAVQVSVLPKNVNIEISAIACF
tara:strand:- start:1029 stop:1433 length:405 start_codon:yes stop_codon:yes gene_type:complete